ncbi:GNAT family N-acetyltransferase [Phaeobacter sp. 11ANDIMAR09]|uniref:GNAT family N-acetyltransferase n=1 Tax=Phaeobacter sp. 11ANDIMAR09 TaxID=1225647 RepID=UPI0006C86A1F|nr:GNAT family acetyltransferase [Phaeobacter sp. 11ANDIMAR09]KPD13809.1 GNAT family acetyltransferase [Phaeobacter sp. 11ANDIMAR09]
MVVGPDYSTDIKDAQFDEVEALLCAAFPMDAEARLVRQLRADGDMLVEIQKPWEGRIGGYYALSRMQAPEGWACLAPMAVQPEWQGGRLAERNPNMDVGGSKDEMYRSPWRFGTRMLQELAAMYEIPLERLPANVPKTIVVLGQPSFYSRYGFSLERAQKLQSPYPLECTLILRHGDDVPEAELIFPAAFSKL